MSDAEVKKPAARGGRNLELPEHLKAYKGVWVFIEHDRGAAHPVSWELLGEGRKLADTLGVSLSGVIMGGPDEPLDAITPRRPTPLAPRTATSSATRCSRATATSPSPRA
jgi:hypothetical protein